MKMGFQKWLEDILLVDLSHEPKLSDELKQIIGWVAEKKRTQCNS